MAMAPLAHARGVALALEAEHPVWMHGEPTLLNELLSNLMDDGPHPGRRQCDIARH